MAQHVGAADSYYNPGSGQAPMRYEQQQPYNGGYQPDKHQQAPPNYGQSYQMNAPHSHQAEGNGKQSFDQAFKIDKPKWNDLWAGILVSRRQLLAIVGPLD